VAEVQRGQVDKVEDQDKLGKAEEGAHEQHDPSEMQQVVEDEVAADGAGLVDATSGVGEEVRDIDGLENEHDEPVDGGNDVVHAERREVVVILSPDRTAMVWAILRVVDCILEGDNHGQQPSDDCEHLVGDNGVLAMLVALRERVDVVNALHGGRLGDLPD